MNITQIPPHLRRCSVTGDFIVPGDSFFILQRAVLKDVVTKGVMQKDLGYILVKREELFSLTPQQLVDLLGEI